MMMNALSSSVLLFLIFSFLTTTSSTSSDVEWENREVGGMRMTWAAPKGLDRREWKGLLLAFAGCSHPSSSDWFELPESRELARAALSHGMAFASATPRASSGCFSAAGHQQVLDVVAWMRALLPTASPRGTPLYAIGVSSGASFLSQLVSSPLLPSSFAAAAFYIMTVRPSSPSPLRWPPSIVVYMERDQTMIPSDKVKASAAMLSSMYPTTPVETVAQHPRPVVVEWLQRIDGLNQLVALQIIAQLKHHKLLDPSTGLFLSDPRLNGWDKLLEGLIDRTGIPRLRDSLAEIFNCAFGQHEVSSEHASRVFQFFLSHS